MLLLFLFLSIEPEIKFGLHYPSAITGNREFYSIYYPSATIFFSREDFSFGLYVDGFYKKIEPYSNQYLQESDLYVDLLAGGFGGTLRWRYLGLATVKAGMGFYNGKLGRFRAEGDGQVNYLSQNRNSLGIFLAWDIFKAVGRIKIGGEARINYIPFSSKPVEDKFEYTYGLFDYVSLTGTAISFMINL